MDFDALSVEQKLAVVRADLQLAQKKIEGHEQMLVLLMQIVAVQIEERPGVLTDYAAQLRNVLFERSQQASG